MKIRLWPGGAGSGYVFENQIGVGVFPEEFVKPIDEGVQEALARGVCAGCPVDDVRIELYDASFHATDSSETVFKIAGSMAFQDVAKKAHPVVLEPLMWVEVVVPTKHVSDVVADLLNRRGQIQSQADRSGTQVVAARVHMAEMLGYAAGLHSLTRGTASYSMRFDRYEPRSGGPAASDEDLSAPVAAPHHPAPKGKASGAAVPEPD